MPRQAWDKIKPMENLYGSVVKQRPTLLLGSTTAGSTSQCVVTSMGIRLWAWRGQVSEETPRCLPLQYSGAGIAGITHIS